MNENLSVVFADTWFWIATFLPRDSDHELAMGLGPQLRSVKIVTSELVLTEFLNQLGHRGEFVRKRSCEAIRRIRANDFITIVPLAETPFADAFSRFETFQDKDWSLTDCSSFQVMNARGIRHAITKDNDFLQAGFMVLP